MSLTMRVHPVSLVFDGTKLALRVKTGVLSRSVLKVSYDIKVIRLNRQSKLNYYKAVSNSLKSSIQPSERN